MTTQVGEPRTIHVAHSPDSDDAFMFHALAEGMVATPFRYVHELSDIASLNLRARRGELEVSAVSIHAYAYLADRYALLSSGSSMGDGYGPRLVSRAPCPADPRAALDGVRVAVEHTYFAKVHLTSADSEYTVDSRPSDAIALALRTEAPIFASESVIRKQSSEELDQWLENLKPEDFGKLDS